MARGPRPAVLRPLAEGDAGALLPLWRDAGALRFTYQPCLRSPRACLEHVRWLVARARQPEGGARSFCVVEGGEVVGIAGLERRPHGVQEIWYALRRAAWGAGLGTRVVARLLQLAADGQTELVRAEVVVENAPSARVLEKNGFRQVEVRRGAFERDGQRRDLAVYAAAAPPPARRRPGRRTRSAQR